MNHQPISFHESTVLKALFDKEVFLIDLDDVTSTNGLIRVSLKFNDVSDLTVNSAAVSAYDAKNRDGEILSLNIDGIGKNCLCLIEWTDFSTHKSLVESIKFKFEDYKLDEFSKK